MKIIFLRSLSLAGVMLALISGFLWWTSGDLQLALIDATNPDADFLKKTSILAAKQNLWAGMSAASSAALIAIAQIFE